MNKPRVKYRGNKYKEAIERLKELRANYKITRLQDYKIKYLKLMENICKDFSISEKTVYRDMKKKIPGLRKNRYDQGKCKTRVSNKEIKIFEEVIMAGNLKAEAKVKANVSQRKVKRITDKIKSQSKVIDKNAESTFGKEAKKFFENIFDFNLIAPNKGIKLKGFLVPKEDLKDIILILANAYNRQCFADEKKLKVSRDELRNIFMHNLVEEQMMLARDTQDYKMIESITRMLDRLNENEKLPDDFETMLKVCKELKPDISREELISLIKASANG